jgi:hypothetical protein
MGIFGNLTNEGLEDAQDRLGGFAPLDTDAYDTKIKLAYAMQSQGGAHGVVLIGDVGGREYRETLWVTNRKGENFFLNRDDKTKKVPLPGFTVVDDICLATTEKPLAEQETEEKVVNIWDADAKKELPKSVPVLTGLIGQTVTLGIVNQLVNKNEKDGAGEYQPTAETRNENVIEKVFHTPTKMTMVEARNGKTEGAFFQTWVDRNKGQVRDRRTIKDGSDAGSSGRPGGAPQSGAGAGAPKKSLFGQS